MSSYRPRPKKTNIVRSRTGCATCRRRRLKCDEEKPECKACRRIEVQCPGYGRTLTFRDDSAAVEEKATISYAAKKRSRKWPMDRQQQTSTMEPSIEISLESTEVRSLQTPENNDEDLNPRMSVVDALDARDILLENLTGSVEMTAVSQDSNIPENIQRTSSLEPSSTDNEMSESVVRSGQNSNNWAGHHDSSGIGMPTGSANYQSYRSFSATVRRFLGVVDSTCPDDVPIVSPSSHSFADGSTQNLSWGPFNDKWSSTSTSYQGSNLERLSYDAASLSSMRQSDFGEELWTDDYYKQHWLSHVLPKLPSVFADLEGSFADLSALENCRLAIASSDVAMMHGQRRWESQLSQPSLHLGRAIVYYGMALREFAQGLSSNFVTEATLRVAILMLFARFELNVGTFNGSIHHMVHLDEIVATDLHEIQQNDIGCRLTCAWFAMRSEFSSNYVPWGLQDFALSFHRTTTETKLRIILEAYAKPYESLLPLFSESQRLSSLVLLERTVGKDASSTTYCDWAQRVKDMNIRAPKKSLTLQTSQYDHLNQLSKLRLQLDQWHDKLHIDALPVESFDSRDTRMNRYGAPGLNVSPLKFHSHDAAMNYAVYACAQLMCSIDHLDVCTGLATHPEGQLSPWVLLVLRVAAGLDISSCIKFNTFRVGLLNILLLVLLRCDDTEAATWIHSRICMFHDLGAHQEASMPIGLAEKLARRLKQEHVSGRSIFLVFTAFGPSMERAELLDDSCKMRGIVHGREHKSAKLFFRDLDPI